MSQRNTYAALVVILMLSCQLLLLATPTAGSDARESPRSQGSKQWGGDMSFPYMMMMMSNSNVIAPSALLIPIVVASCTMLFIRGTMD